nr:MAG TPA: hypothetical protein [Caudoviricetes sp.]
MTLGHHTIFLYNIHLLKDIRVLFAFLQLSLDILRISFYLPSIQPS